MIVTLSLTILTESIVVVVYCLLRRKPPRSIWLTSTCGNLITQALLWAVLRLLFQEYLAALLIMELLIWMIEGVLLSVIPANELQFKDALLLSLMMNLVSFSAGWVLPL